MISKAKPMGEQPDGKKLVQVTTGLYKMEPSGRYYANIRRQGKLLRQSLQTTENLKLSTNL